MIFENYPIPLPLEPYIEAIFYFKDFMPDHHVERFVPTGNIYLLFELDGITRHTLNNELVPLRSFTNAWISGMQRYYLNISAHPHSEMLVVKFKPFGAFPVFQFPIDTINDCIEPAERFFGADLLNLRNQIIENKSVTEKFAAMEAWLIDHCDPALQAPEELVQVMEALQAHPFARHQEILAGYPKSQKHLIQQFKKYGGLTPKIFHRILRFNKLLENINLKESIVWSDISYETGYADQSHFIKDFNAFCGINPTSYIQNGFNDSIPNFFPLDREG
ncbi:MAG: AraC family transcriptional regulator [Saprospiraceae bacterium]|nr:AraC family transcriptional regulator [Saprospiraceae bacterium]